MNDDAINKTVVASDNWYFWRSSLIALLVCITIIFFIYSNTIVQMVSVWSSSDTYAHSFIVPLISLWLIWRIRGKWVFLKPEKSWTALFFMLGFAVLWLAGDLVSVNVITQLAFVSMIILCVPALFGWSVTSTLTFPLLFLYFSVPIGDFMLPVMMEWTADFTVLALRFTGIPVYREGLQFVIPSGNWSVVEACSGIRYLIASVTVGCLFAYINYQSYIKRFIFIAFSVAVPLIANWLRAYLIVLVGHYSGNELATGVDHLIYGWLFFGLVIISMLFIGARWAEQPVLSDNKKKSFRIKNSYNSKVNNKIYKFSFFIMLIVAAPHALEKWISLKNSQLPVQLENVLATWPWNNLQNPPSNWTPEFLNAAAQSDTGFENNMQIQVGLHISYYRKQNYKSKLVTSANNLISEKNKKWIKVFQRNQEVLFNNKNYYVKNSVLHQKEVSSTDKNKNLHVWHFYWVNGKITSNDLEAKVQGVMSKITGKGDDSAIIAIYTPYMYSEVNDKNLKITSDILQEFININGDVIMLSLQKTRDNI